MAQPTMTLPPGREEELNALDSLADEAEENAREERVLARRIRQLRTGRAAGRSWHTLLDRELGTALLAMPTRILRRATDVSGLLRRRLAAGLRAEGATIPAIARRFGVTHQRISTLLRNNHRPPE